MYEVSRRSAKNCGRYSIATFRDSNLVKGLKTRRQLRAGAALDSRLVYRGISVKIGSNCAPFSLYTCVNFQRHRGKSVGVRAIPRVPVASSEH